MNRTRACADCTFRTERIPFMLLALLVSGMLLFAGSAMAKPVLEIIQLQHRQGMEMVEVIKPVLKEGASVSAMGSKLVIQADEEDMLVIKALIRKLDKAAHNFRLIVKFTTTETSEKKDDGAAVANNNGKAQIKVRSKRVLTTTVKETIQRATVMENAWARFRLLESKPVTVVTTEQGKNGEKIQKTVTVASQEATGFRILPRMSGGKILLTIASVAQALPQTTGQNPGQTKSVQNNMAQTIAAETSIMIPENQWVSIGGSSDNSSQSDRQLVIPAIGFLQTEGMRNTTIEVKAELLD